MVSTKSALIAIFVATLVSITLAGPNYNGCAIIDLNGKCLECFERKLKLDGSGCGPALPKSDNCLLYAIRASNGTNYSSCTTCKTGYANRIEYNNGGYTQKCVKASLTNCLEETDIVFQSGTHTICNTCANNEYSVDNTTKTSI